MADPEVIEEVAGALTNDAPLDHRDDINNDVRAAIEGLKSGDTNTALPADLPPSTEKVAAPGDTDKTGTTETVDGRARAPDGKFLPKTAETTGKELPPTESVAKASEQPSQAVAPPVSWAAEAKALWASTPPAIQNAVLKREQEASNGIRQYSEKTARYEQALAPVAQEASKRGMSPDDAIKRLIDGNTFLETQPEQAILWLAQKNGIDLANLASNPPAAQPVARPDPAFAQVSQTVETLQQRLQQIEFGNNLSVAQQFAASKPHYADVEDQLPDFIREVQKLDPSLSGVALLEKAYDRAIWLNPDVRAKVQAAERAEAEKTRLATVTAKATQANRAAVSVKGSSATALPPKQAASEGGTVYDDVRASLHQLRNAG